MHPPRRIIAELNDDHARENKPSDKENQERGGAIANVKRLNVEAAAAALWCETDPASKQGWRAAFWAEAEERDAP